VSDTPTYTTSNPIIDGRAQTPTSVLVANGVDITNTVLVGPPIDGINDDWASVASAVASAPAGTTVRLRQSSTPYVCNHQSVVAKSGVTLDLRNTNIVSTTAFGLSTCPIYSNPVTSGTIATTNGTQAANATVLNVTWSGSDRFAVGDYLLIRGSKGNRISFQVIAVGASTVTIDTALKFSIPTGYVLQRFAPVQNFKEMFF
jgi:hypothetical protein